MALAVLLTAIICSVSVLDVYKRQAQKYLMWKFVIVMIAAIAVKPVKAQSPANVQKMMGKKNPAAAGAVMRPQKRIKNRAAAVMGRKKTDS